MNGTILFFTYTSQHAIVLILMAIFSVYHISRTKTVVVTCGEGAEGNGKSTVPCLCPPIGSLIYVFLKAKEILHFPRFYLIFSFSSMFLQHLTNASDMESAV